MPDEEYKNSSVLRTKKFFLIVLYIQTYLIVLLFGIFAHPNLCIKSKKKKKKKERALRLPHNCFAIDYAELLKKSAKATMEI